jgi:hypothetical protein
MILKQRVLALAVFLSGMSLALAEVPSLINYQGRLTESNGAPVTGTKTVSLEIYDSAVNGKVLYTELIGPVVIAANGIYNFQFGASGTSNTLITETLASTDGVAAAFQKILSNGPLTANSLTVSDGVYNWTQVDGSSDDTAFGVAYSATLRRVTVNYYNGAPGAGKTITATYRYGTAGISGALSSSAEHWMALSVDGATQGTRQRVLAVPFALRADVAKSALSAPDLIARQQISDLMVSVASGRSTILSMTLSKSSNYAGSLVQAIGYTKFDGGPESSYTFDTISSAQGSKTADYFVITPGIMGPAASSTSGWYEVFYTDGVTLHYDFTGRTQIIQANQRPNAQVDKLRCFFSYPYGYTKGNQAAIFTEDNATATFTVSCPDVPRGAFCVYSTNGAPVADVTLKLKLQNGTTISCDQCTYVDLISPVVEITVQCSSQLFTATISTIKLLY